LPVSVIVDGNGRRTRHEAREPARATADVYGVGTGGGEAAKACRAKRRADRLANGLMLPAELLTQLDKLAAELAIKPLRERA